MSTLAFLEFIVLLIHEKWVASQEGQSDGAPFPLYLQSPDGCGPTPYSARKILSFSILGPPFLSKDYSSCLKLFCVLIH